MPDHKILDCPFAFSKELTDSGQFEGHAAIFSNVDLQNDRIRKGAFTETIEESGGRWPVLMGHNTGRVVGFSTAAAEDSKGLFVAGEFTLASDEGRNAHATAKHAAALGQKFGLSIGYMLRGENAADYNEQTSVRTLKNLTVLEFSLAAIPANPRARISSVKDLNDVRNWTVRDFEEHLREAGFSHQTARAIASHSYEALVSQREAGDESEDAVRAFMSRVAREGLLLQR